MNPAEIVREKRDEILAPVARNGALYVCVSGQAACSQADEKSDLFSLASSVGDG